MSSTGSVYQRSDGYWVAAVVVAGKKVAKYGKTKRDAQKRLQALLNAQHTGTLAPPTHLTLEQYVGQWLATQETTRRPSTLRYYRQALAPIVERLGKVRLDRLTPAALTFAFADLRRAGRGTRLIQQSYIVLGTCLRAAVRLGVLGASPLERVEKPRHEPQAKEYWTAEETRRFIEVAEGVNHRYAPLFLLAVAGGLRLGEALGLTWADIDWQPGTVNIQRAYVYAGQRGSIQPPKSKAGRRSVRLPDAALGAIRKLPRPLAETALIFLTRNGTVPTNSDLRQALHRLCDRAEVPRLNPHGLRHVHAALLVQQGVDLQTLRRRLGHSRVDMSLNVYAYALGSDSAAADAFSRAVELADGGCGSVDSRSMDWMGPYRGSRGNP